MRLLRSRAPLVSSVVTALLVGCGHAAPAVREPERSDGYARIAAALRSRGAEVTIRGWVDEPFMPVPAQLLSVDGANVEVFDLADERAALTYARGIAPDASRVGSEDVMWEAAPHFYRAGRSIVLYVGDDPRLLATLEDALGEPIAAARLPKPPAICEEDVPTTRA